MNDRQVHRFEFPDATPGLPPVPRETDARVRASLKPRRLAVPLPLAAAACIAFAAMGYYAPRQSTTTPAHEPSPGPTQAESAPPPLSDSPVDHAALFASNRRDPRTDLRGWR